MKNIAFLDNLRIELQDAKNGVGQQLVEVEKQYDIASRLLTVFREKMKITSYLGEDAYRLSDFDLNFENKEIFKELVYDLVLRNILIHKEDSLIEKTRVFQDTRLINEITDGKNIVIKSKNRFRQYVNQFKKIFDGIHEQVDKEEKNESKVEKNKNGQVEKLVVGPLVYGIDGGMYFKGKLIKMRPQIKTLCILFMQNHKKRVDYSTIKDEVIDAKKRNYTGFTTITKYVSELHNLLKKHFKRDVIINDEDQGYIFDIGKNS